MSRLCLRTHGGKALPPCCSARWFASTLRNRTFVVEEDAHLRFFESSDSSSHIALTVGYFSVDKELGEMLNGDAYWSSSADVVKAEKKPQKKPAAAAGVKVGGKKGAKVKVAKDPAMLKAQQTAKRVRQQRAQVSFSFFSFFSSLPPPPSHPPTPPPPPPPRSFARAGCVSICVRRQRQQ